VASEPAPVSTSALRVGGQGGTIEDLVIELLRPMMREWLDQNLPIIVERIVQKEIRRLVRRADTD
jgi:cell pole-organizing protein PopZ